MDEHWDEVYSILIDFIKSNYHNDKTIKHVFGIVEIDKAWNLYGWLETQMCSMDLNIQQKMINFIETDEYSKFIITFIASGFVRNETCKLLEHFKRFLEKHINTVKKSPFCQTHQHIKNIMFPTANSDSNIYMSPSVIDNDYNDNNHNNNIIPNIILEKYGKCSCKYTNRVNVIIAETMYKIIVCKNDTKSRDNVQKRLGGINCGWKWGLAYFHNKNARTKWRDFLHSDLYNSFKKRNVSYDMKAIVKIITYLLESYNVLLDTCKKSLFSIINFHNNNWTNKKAEMINDEMYNEWGKFRESIIYENFSTKIYGEISNKYPSIMVNNDKHNDKHNDKYTDKHKKRKICDEPVKQKYKKPKKQNLNKECAKNTIICKQFNDTFFDELFEINIKMELNDEQFINSIASCDNNLNFRMTPDELMARIDLCESYDEWLMLDWMSENV